jgi:phytoene dehydrogenase-like protein
VPSTDADVVVIGAGITGLCTALLLARAGQDVVVLEATRVGALASGRNTGKVSVLQGTRLSRLLETHPEPVASAAPTGTPGDADEYDHADRVRARDNDRRR